MERFMARHLPYLMVLGALLGSLLLPLPSQAAGERRLLFIAAAPVQAGKFERLKPLAAKAGFRLDYRMLDGASAAPGRAELETYDLLIIDAPYGAAQAAAQAGVAPQLDELGTPWLWLRRDGTRARQLPEALVADLEL